jgi:hypothetical protein
MRAHEDSGWRAKSTSSAWPLPLSAGTREPTSPEAISWRTSFAVITQRDPSTRRQSGLGRSRPAARAASAAL